jgi:YD repeat-containing protein
MTSVAHAAVYEYDELDRLIKVTYDSGQIVTYTYDDAGNMLSVTNESVVSLNIQTLSKSDGNIRLTPAESFMALPPQDTTVFKINGEPVPVEWQPEGIQLNLYQDTSLSLETLTQPVQLKVETSDGNELFSGCYPFEDVCPHFWFANPVIRLWRDDIIQGDGNFEPITAATREVFVVTLAKALAKQANPDVIFAEFFVPPPTKPYDDIETDRESAPYIQYLKDQELIQGCGDGNNFCPTAPVIKADAIAVAVTAFDGDTLAEFENGREPQQLFQDVTDPNEWYYPYVYTVQAQEWLHGYSNNTFKPEQPLTRAEAAKLISIAAFGIGDDQPTIAYVSPLTAFTEQPTVFKVRAIYLPESTVFSIADCSNLEVLLKEAEEWYFRCTPTSIGIKPGIIKDQPNGNVLFNCEITVSPTNKNHTPVIGGLPTTVAGINVPYSFIPEAYDFDAEDTLTFRIANKPSWANFNSVTGELSGTPTQIGTTNAIVISVTDGQSNASLPAFDLTIKIPISVTPISHDYGEVALGTTALKTFTVSNNGEDNLIVSEINFAGDSDFSVNNETCSQLPLQLNATCNVEIAFSPTSAENSLKEAKLSIVSTDQIIPQLEVDLAGILAIKFSFSGSLSWDDHNKTTRKVTASGGNPGWPACMWTGDQSKTTSIKLSIPCQHNVVFSWDHNGNCSSKSSHYRIGSGNWIALPKSKNVLL